MKRYVQCAWFLEAKQNNSFVSVEVPLARSEDVRQEQPPATAPLRSALINSRDRRKRQRLIFSNFPLTSQSVQSDVGVLAT